MNDAMLTEVSAKEGFIAALDQSGGSPPGALRLCGMPESDYSGEIQMFALDMAELPTPLNPQPLPFENAS